MDSACELNTMSEEDELRLRNRELKKEMLDRIVESMRQCFGLTFFGVDVIIEDKTGNYVVIDINNFRECSLLRPNWMILKFNFIITIIRWRLRRSLR